MQYRRLLVVLRRGKPHITTLGILHVAQFIVLCVCCGLHCTDIIVETLIKNNIENNLVDTTIKTREKELHLAEISVACSVMNSTTMKGVGKCLLELVNNNCTKKIKHIEDSPTATNSKLEYNYKETDIDGLYDVDEAKEI
ncbi:6255_t:CDS:2 [Cetraspora pellucida]|uniref:6255_t:CDS:1 n=1 Tax=Cetraspora pellucida TaxID=1433469 RepID=A0A9N9IF98_9GLOM|nr:6255_t:CDS:2 [Cetraspora pellucida]